ncbi:hypothetical protein AAS21_gp074 [Pantoea phage vB_PagS_AAS21]|uniref:Uncharacterized protein n=1 Tax=Pantoea phage vB_PagS_AAS21 TaxID=2575261 RepID=A0A4Y5P1I6_9CAUD|nr:hypothetical protein AAS21_gp074 [Pantoea phage vB_PagS_AAS21]
MKTVVILGVDKLGRKVTEKVSAPANTSFAAMAKDKLGLVKVSAIMTENMFNKSKEV